jgi:pentapeptide repeat protein
MGEILKVGSNNDNRTKREYRADWWVSSFAIILIVGIASSFIFWPDRNFVQLTTSLITALGVVLTLRATQVRSIEQQEREDRRHNARLEAEAKIHDERIRAESKREHERLTADAQKDRAQRLITQRIDLADKLISAIGHLSSDNELQQAAGVQEILFQIDDWHALIRMEIDGILDGDEHSDLKRKVLLREGLRHRQELFDISYKFKIENIDVLKSRARGMRQRLAFAEENSLMEIDMSDIVIGSLKYERSVEHRQDLRNIIIYGAKMSRAYLQGIDMRNSTLQKADLSYAQLLGANLSDIDLTGAQLSGANLQKADLRRAQLPSAELTSASLIKADLVDANLVYARLEGADLSKVIAPASNFSHTNMFGANFSGANLRIARFNDALLRSVSFRNADLWGACLAGANLSAADLCFANLRGVNFSNSQLPYYKLRDAIYDDSTIFPEGFDPENPEYGLVKFVNKFSPF